MKKNVINAEELRELSGRQLLDKINTENLSLLCSMGANELFEEMVPTGAICRGLIDTICAERNDARLRQMAIALLKPSAPAKLIKKLPAPDACVVMGFNHPSLGEIFRLLYLGFEAYPDRKFLFPVNIPWYENLAPDIPKLERLGVFITPIITPSTEAKLRKVFAGDEQRLEDITRYKNVFEREYMKSVGRFAKEKSIIVVAPSATRQAGVFASEEARLGKAHIHPTMTLIAHMALKHSDAALCFLPIAVIEPKNNNRKLNLFKRYKIYPCEPFYTEEVRELCSGHSRDFDYRFLKRIDAVYRHKSKL